jgi:type II secretory pathway pseudopilin PulG
MRGHTLVELTFVLLLVGVAASSVAPTARQARDWAAVAAAREAVVGLLVEARQAAIEAGSGSAHFSTMTGVVQVSSAGTMLRRVDLTAEFGVSLELSGARSEVELRYDPLGLGRMASQTVVVRRGRAVTALTVSAYGRVSRR